MLWRTSRTFSPRPGFIEPCVPTRADKVPDGPMWIHEIKHDGYRLIVRRVEDRVRLFTRNGFDWTERFPRVLEGAKRLKARSFIIDGEAVICGSDGVADFAKLHSRAYENEVVLFGFDLLELNGEDLRPQPTEKRKSKLEKLLSRARSDIHFTEHMDDDGALMFKHACKWGWRASSQSAAMCRIVPADVRAS